MFDFFSMSGNYANRAVSRYEADGMIVDTALVTDGNQPYETGICHPEYNHGDWIIVEAYDTRQEAQVGHDKWVARMTSEPLPSSLKDCQNAEISQLFYAISKERDYPRAK